MNVALSLVIPAFNEAGRLPVYLEAIRDYFTTDFSERYEVIVVDDGSQDGTGEVLHQWTEMWEPLSVLTHVSNRGKGAAVRTGMLSARGGMVLFADADGATPIDEERKLREAITAGADVAIGVRGRGGTGGPKACRPWHRDLAGRVFSGIARGYLSLPVADTQCGFKMFARSVVPSLFGPCRENGYLFDLYVLKAADRLNYRVVEIPVAWEEIRGSKVHILRDSWRMLTGLERIRRDFTRAGGSSCPPIVASSAAPARSSSEPDFREATATPDPLLDACPGSTLVSPAAVRT